MAVEHSAEARGQLVAMLRRRMRLLIALVVAGTVAGVGAGILLPAQYSATASVLVSPLEGNPYSPEGRGDDLINLETEAQLVQTDAVAELVQQKLKGQDVSALRASVSTVVPPNTQILNIVYNSDSGDSAETGARAFAEAYLKYRQQRAQAVINGKLKKLDEQATKVQENMAQANQQLAGASGTQRTLLGQRITAYANQLGVIDEQKNDVSSTPVEPGQVINPASAKGGAGTKRIGIFGAGGLVAGALLGLALVLTRERLDRRLRTAEQVEALGLRVLSIVPPGTGGELALADGARTPAGDAYRRLRSGIVANIQATPLTMLVASATPATTTSTTGTNLAVALAYAGSDTILVDATADEPDPAASFGLPPGKGLAEILLKGTDPAALLIHADSQLRLLTRGTNPAAAAHRFSGPRMRDAVDTLRDRADFVLVNAPDVHDADTQALCTLVDTVVLVVQDGATTREDLQQAYAEVVHAGSTVLGVVIESASGAAQRPVRHSAPPRPAPAQQQPGGRAADRRRSGPPGEWGRQGEPGDARGDGRDGRDGRGDGRGESRARGARRAGPPRGGGRPPLDESDTNTTVTLPALPAGPGKSGPPKSPPPGGRSSGGPSQGGSSQGGSSQSGRPSGGSSQGGPAQSGPAQGTPVASGLAKSPPPANGTSGHRRGDKPADRRPPAGRSGGGGRHGTRGASQHFGSDRLAGRETPDPEDKSVAGGPEEDSPANRTRDDFGI